MQMQMLIDQLKNSVQEKMNEDAGEGYHSCPCCRSVYDTGALSLSLPAPSSSASSFSYLISASSASRPACVSVGTPLWISFSKYLGTNLPPTPSKKKTLCVENREKATHSTPRLLRSAASSRWRCSMMCFARVASPNSLLINLLVTLSQSRRLSVGSCREMGRTVFGTACSGVRSISVVHSVVVVLLPLASEDGVDLPDPSETGRQRTTLRQQPSKCPTIRERGTCFTLVHSSCSCSDGSYRCTTPSTR